MFRVIWTCDGCGTRTPGNDTSATPPTDWTSLGYTVRAYVPYKVNLQLCPNCSNDIDAALAQFQARLSSQDKPPEAV